MHLLRLSGCPLKILRPGEYSLVFERKRHRYKHLDLPPERRAQPQT